MAIKSVASVLATYDSNQKFPVFGFGAKAPELGGVSHCFPLNMNPDNPEVDGVQVCIMMELKVCSNFKPFKERYWILL